MSFRFGRTYVQQLKVGRGLRPSRALSAGSCGAIGHSNRLGGDASPYLDCFEPGVRILSLREVPLGGTTKQSSWIATARFAHLAMTIISKTHFGVWCTADVEPDDTEVVPPFEHIRTRCFRGGPRPIASISIPKWRDDLRVVRFDVRTSLSSVSPLARCHAPASKRPTVAVVVMQETVRARVVRDAQVAAIP